MGGLLSAALWRRLLLALAPLLLVLEIPGAAEQWRRPDDGLRLRNRIVMEVVPGGPADRAGLRPGDRILAIDDLPIANYGTVLAAMHGHHAGDRLRLRVQRGGMRDDIELVLAPRALTERMRDVLLTAIALCFLFLGFITYLRRKDALGRWWHLSCVFLAYNFLDLPTFPWPFAMHVLEGLRDGFQLLLAASLLRFAFLFPESDEPNARRRRQRRRIMLAPALLAPLNLALYFQGPTALESPFAIVVQGASALVVIGYLVAALVVLVRRSRRRYRWQQWSKLRLALLSVLVGLLPLLLAALLRVVFPMRASVVEDVALLFLPLAPAGFSVALTRGGAIDLALLTRRATVALVLAVPVLGGGIAIAFAIAPLVDEQRFGVGVIAAAAGTLILAAGVVPLRHAAARAVDRAVYPEQGRVRAEAAALARRLNGLRDADELAAALCDGLRGLVGARGATLYAKRPGGNYRLLAHGNDDASLPPPAERLPADASLVRKIESAAQLLVLPPLLGGSRPLRLDSASRLVLHATNCELAVPLLSAGHPVGILWLGPSTRRNYGSAELFHIEQLAQLAGTTIDNALLHEQDLARERHQTELALAKDIQSRLLPDHDLQHEQFHACGRMQASQEVGGDLFDHFVVPDGRVALCVADAAGKGVPASILMSSVRTAVRDLVRPGAGIADIVSELNRKVHGMTAETHFVALFLGLLDPETQVLEYVVAGIEPPLWYRASDGRVELLTRGGAVLGIDPSFGYRSGLVRIEEGDVVLAYSDGITDEEDVEEMPFGIERLRATLQRSSELDSEGIASAVMSAVAEHGHGVSTDDRTVLVLTRTSSERRGMKAAAS